MNGMIHVFMFVVALAVVYGSVEAFGMILARNWKAAFWYFVGTAIGFGVLYFLTR